VAPRARSVADGQPSGASKGELTTLCHASLRA
jgi:hypothetical protein